MALKPRFLSMLPHSIWDESHEHRGRVIFATEQDLKSKGKLTLDDGTSSLISRDLAYLAIDRNPHRMGHRQHSLAPGRSDNNFGSKIFKLTP